jgi:hypothetical protein
MAHKPIDVILDPYTIDALRASSVGTCEILDPDASRRTPVWLTPPRKLTADQLAALKALLLDPRSWFFARKRCLPRNTALFRLQSGECRVQIVVGMPCLEWTITGPRGSSGGFFDPVAKQVRALLKDLFSEYASPFPRSMWRSGAIAQLRANDMGFAGRG